MVASTIILNLLSLSILVAWLPLAWDMVYMHSKVCCFVCV